MSITTILFDLDGTLLPMDNDEFTKVYFNVYIPKAASDTKLPVLFNAHGGGFFLGDADEMDTQCDLWANDWNVIVVSVNYTKLDTKPMDYAVAEITDTVANKYVKEPYTPFGGVQGSFVL